MKPMKIVAGLIIAASAARAEDNEFPIWPGIATERVGAKRPASEMVRQIQLTRQGDLSNNAPGHIHWSMKALMDNQGGVSDLLRREVYDERAEAPRR